MIIPFLIIYLHFIVFNQCSVPKFPTLLSQLTKIRQFQKIPDYIKICHRSDPLLSQCIHDAIEKLKPHIHKVMLDFKLPNLDPHHISELTMNQGKRDSVVQSRYKNFEIYGLSQFTLISVKFELRKMKVMIKIWIPDLYIVSNYSINGHILSTPILESGKYKANYSDIDVFAEINLEYLRRNQDLYFNVKDAYVRLKIGQLGVNFSNLRNGDIDLNGFLNENYKDVAEEMRPVLEKTILKLIKRYTNGIFQKYPSDILLPS